MAQNRSDVYDVHDVHETRAQHYALSLKSPSEITSWLKPNLETAPLESIRYTLSGKRSHTCGRTILLTTIVWMPGTGAATAVRSN